MKKLYFLVFLLLASCMTPEQIAAQKQEIERRKVQFCANMGAPPGSPNYYDCRMRIERQLAYEAQMEQQADAQYLQSLSESQRQLGAQMGNTFNHNSMRCRSYTIGNQLYTDCN